MAPQVFINKRQEAMPTASNVMVVVPDSGKCEDAPASRETAFCCISIRTSAYLAIVLACINTFSYNLIAGGVITAVAVVAIYRQSIVGLSSIMYWLCLAALVSLGIAIYGAYIVTTNEPIPDMMPSAIHTFRLAGVFIVVASAYVNLYFAFVIRKHITDLRAKCSAKIERRDGVQVLSV